MKKEAEANAAADAKEKRKIDKLNHADTVIFQTEKQLQELGDKIPADKKAQIDNALNKLKEAHKAQDIAAIDSAITEIQNTFEPSSRKSSMPSRQPEAHKQVPTPEPHRQATPAKATSTT